MLETLFAGPWGPVVIFFLRICDVSLSTVRTMLMLKDQKKVVPIIAFFEVLVWVTAAGNAIRNLHSPVHLFFYSAGFAGGTAAGMWLEEKLAFGFAQIRIVSRKRGGGMAGVLRLRGFGVTEFEARGVSGFVEVFLTVVRRRDVDAVVAEVLARDPEAFITLEEPKVIRSGWLLHKKPT